MKQNRILTVAVIILMVASFLLLEYGEEPVAAQAPGANAPLAIEDHPTFLAAADGGWVQSSSPWTPGATISLTIDDGGAGYSDSQTADGGGHFYFNLRDRFDLQRGHVVTVGDGSITKTHTVTNLFADHVNVAADTVSGRADAGTSVNVYVHGGGELNVTADGSGNWMADFSATTDITYLSDGGAQQVDADGDATWEPWAGPRFWVAADGGWVQSSSQWTPGATVVLTIADGSGVVYADSQTADAGGDFYFNLWDLFDLQGGHVVTVSDGTYAKTHSVANLSVDIVDVTADTLSGRADAGADVDVWAEGSQQTVTADGSGNWLADFSATADITYLSEDDALQSDADGDATWVRWSGPKFQVAPDDDWVESSGPGHWTPGATISLTIEDGGGVVYADTQTADGNGRFNFNLWDVFDLQRGHVVTISDGINSKVHTVTNLFVDVVNVTADTVSGRADAGADVEVSVHDGEGTNLVATADGSGNWTADFSGMTDLIYQSDGGSQQFDDDGDATGVWWNTPQFRVAIDDWVQSSSRWSPGATISLTIEDGGGVVYADSQPADAGGSFDFYFGDVFELQRGHEVTVSDGMITKTHTVTNLFVDGIDVDADIVFGRADAGSDVDVWVHDDQGSSVTVTADGSGEWTADFSAMTDLTYASSGGSQQFDDDGDATGVWWDSPRFQAAPDDDWVQSSSRWSPGATISLTIEDGGGVAYADSQTADGEGNFNFNLGGIFDLQRGHEVTVGDGTITKTHTVTNLFVDGIDVDADTVFGRADAGSDVDVWVHDDQGSSVTVTADGSGEWTADFSSMTDLTGNSDGGLGQSDDDGDSTGVWWRMPQFTVAPEDDGVGSSSQWAVGATISLTIEDGGGVAYADWQTADGEGNFHFNLGGVFDVQRGHEVSVSDGMITKTHTVTGLFVDGVDVDADTVFGRADAGSDVDVWVNDDQHSSMTVTADGSGDWTADFSTMTDLTHELDGGSQQIDEDGDATGVWWNVPKFWVSPEDDWVESSSSWAPGSAISLTIEDGVSVVYADAQTADPYGNFHFNLGGVFDLQRGHEVTVSDGMISKTHTVIGLFVDGVDVDADIVFGRADAGADVEVWVHDDQGSSMTVTADGSGEWAADFSAMSDLTYESDGGSQQIDEDGDATGVWWAAATVQEIPLHEGWNMISSYIEAGDPAVTSILADIVDDVVLIKDGEGNVYWPDMGVDEIGDWEVHKGYQIYMDNGTTLSIRGTAVDPAATPIELESGWSLIAYLRDGSMPVGPAIDTISGALYLVKNRYGEVYWPAYGVDQIGDMQPGQGYQVYMDGPGTLIYP